MWDFWRDRSCYSFPYQNFLMRPHKIDSMFYFSSRKDFAQILEKLYTFLFHFYFRLIFSFAGFDLSGILKGQMSPFSFLSANGRSINK